MQQTTRLKLTELNNHLTCVLCAGYFVDATAIIECHHSFCRSCIVRHLEQKKTCPTCENVVHKTKPLLNLRPDRTLQTLVYKLVPGLYQNEMQRRRKFYHANPTTVPLSGEDRGEMENNHLIYTEDEKISLCLQHCDRFPSVHLPADAEVNSVVKTEGTPHKRHLLCPALVTIGHLKKFVRHKFDLSPCYQVEIFHTRDSLKDACTLMDVANIYSWKRVEPLRLYYIVFDKTQLSLELLPEPTDKPIITTTIRLPVNKQKNKRKNSSTKSPKNNLVKSRRFKPPAFKSPKSPDDTKPKTRKKYKKKGKIDFSTENDVPQKDEPCTQVGAHGSFADNPAGMDYDDKPLSELKGKLNGNDPILPKEKECSVLPDKDKPIPMDSKTSDIDTDDAKSCTSDVTIICADYEDGGASSKPVVTNTQKDGDADKSHTENAESSANIGAKGITHGISSPSEERPATEHSSENKKEEEGDHEPPSTKKHVNKVDPVKSPIKNKPKCLKDNPMRNSKVLGKDISLLEKDNKQITSSMKSLNKEKRKLPLANGLRCKDSLETETKKNKVNSNSSGNVVVPFITEIEKSERNVNQNKSTESDVEMTEVTDKAIDLVNQPDLVRSSQVAQTSTTTCNCALKKGSDCQMASNTVKSKEEPAPVKPKMEVVTRAADTSNPLLDVTVLEDKLTEKTDASTNGCTTSGSPVGTTPEAHELSNRESPSPSVCSLTTTQSDNTIELQSPSPLSESGSQDKQSNVTVANKAPGHNSASRARKLSGPGRDKAKSINSIIKRIEERNQGLQNSKRSEQSGTETVNTPARSTTLPSPVTPKSSSSASKLTADSPSPVHSTVPRTFSPILSQTKMTASPPQQHIQQLLRQNNIPIGLSGLTPGRGMKRTTGGSRGRGSKRAQSPGSTQQDTTPIKRLRQMCNGFGEGQNGVKQTASKPAHFTVGKPQIAQRPQYVGIPRGAKSGMNVDPRVVMNQALARAQMHAHNNNNNNMDRRPQQLASPNYSYQKPSDSYSPVPSAAHAHGNGQHVSPGGSAGVANANRSPRSNVHPAHNNYKPYYKPDYVAPNPRANGYDEPLELTTKPSRDRKRAEEHVINRSGPGRGPFLKIPSLVKP